VTRATLLQLLAHPTALNGADVHALEQLADAFPYCQTAHLLLAKAAHDQGSMLAGQRLRRAATYAADRTHLRQLIELPVLAAVPAGLVTADTQVAAPLSALTFIATLEEPTLIPTSEIPEQQAAEAFEDKPGQVIGQPESAALLPKVEAEAPTADELPEPAIQPEAEAPTENELPESPSFAEAAVPTEVVVEAEEELPVQAPPIRPPAEAENARFEFGLAEQEPAEIMAYRLPELAETPAGEVAVPATPRLPAFRGLPEISYVAEEGSRLGWCLVASAANEPRPGTSLPPVGEFFAPDALLLAHLATHQPPAAPRPSSISLIDSFLQRAPAATRRRSLPSLTAAEPAAQADLSVRSTHAAPDLASESLAKILVRQGKTDRAIAVYERLMVKHPEKMAYFAAQIESLRPSA
jgi:hypothetical protein